MRRFERVIGGIGAGRERHAVGGGGADQRGAAHLHAANGVRRLIDGRQARDDEGVRQLRLVDDLDAVAVRGRPDGPIVPSFDLHRAVSVRRPLARSR